MANLTRELRECETDELEQRLVDARQELFNLRFQHVTGQLDNSARLGHVRRQVARLHTLLREREIEAAEALEAAEQQATGVGGRAGISETVSPPGGPSGGDPTTDEVSE
jgi:large subunit ribosomal protein L29